MAKKQQKYTTLTESWLIRNWRPAMAWQYFTVCLFDFIVGPIFHAYSQSNAHQATINQWTPLTLQGGGLYHLAMAAIIGIYSYGRTLERINLANKGIISGKFSDNLFPDPQQPPQIPMPMPHYTPPTMSPVIPPTRPPMPGA